MTHTKTFGSWAAGVLGVVALTGMTNLAWADQGAVRITVRIQSEGNVPGAFLTGARVTVTSMYRKSGAEIVWTEDANADLIIVLRGNSKATQMHAEVGEMGRALVSAATGRGRLAYVFYGHIEARWGQAGRDAAPLLGLVIAHEMGHLLGFAHSATGIMRAPWSQADLILAAQGNLLFNREQVESLRSQTHTK